MYDADAPQICWYLAAVVLVQLCKHYIENGDQERESRIWGEINVLRFAMLEYGSRSPIGSKSTRSLGRWEHVTHSGAPARQERLLQGLMREIVRMTAQKHPLEVNVPLYPFSHRSLFQKDDHTQNHHPAPMESNPMANGHLYAPSNGSDRTLSPGNLNGLTPPNMNSVSNGSWSNMATPPGQQQHPHQMLDVSGGNSYMGNGL